MTLQLCKPIRIDCQVKPVKCLQNQASLAESSKEEKDNLDSMLLLMVDEPLVIVVKLADRLHNMRTAYALAPNKRRAVATETLEVWCTLAERLGMFAIKVGKILQRAVSTHIYTVHRNC